MCEGVKTTPSEREHFLKSAKIAKTLGTQMSDEYRSYMEDNIVGKKTILSNNQSVIFLSGDMTTCGIHSEPKIDTMRMFLSIVPGSTKEIEGWKHPMNGGSSHNDPMYYKYKKYKLKYLNLKQ